MPERSQVLGAFNGQLSSSGKDKKAFGGNFTTTHYLYGLYG
ncbi:MAG: hypothetical protein ACM3NR_00070 [Methanosarcina sp.]